VKSRALLLAALAVLGAFLVACKTPPVPAVVNQAIDQEKELWRAEAAVYVPEEYRVYLSSLRLARDKLIQQKARFGWFRNYEEVEKDFRAIIETGQALLEKIEKEKALRSSAGAAEVKALREQFEKIKNFTLTIREADDVRRSLTRGEVALREAEICLEKQKLTELSGKIRIVNIYLDQAHRFLFSLLARYADEDQINLWRRWAEETVAESREKRATALVINKLEKTLTVYKAGKIAATYNIGLGKYGLSDKLHAGDEATPEGKYRVVRKNPQSRFYKALLLDYPNEEDRQRFSLAKKQGLIPANAGIGSLIEIHGGGEDSLTGGCIAVEDSVMDELFLEVSVGTPVTIVGSLKSVAELLTWLKGGRR